VKERAWVVVFNPPTTRPLGVTRLRIESDDGGSPVIDITDSRGGIPNVFELRLGENQIAQSGATASRFVLKEGRPYLLTLCGNNGWARKALR
jgi:hypothetical protein